MSVDRRHHRIGEDSTTYFQGAINVGSGDGVLGDWCNFNSKLNGAETWERWPGVCCGVGINYTDGGGVVLPNKN